MSNYLNSSMNGSASYITDNSGRSFPSSFSAQTGAGSSDFHHSGIQGLYNMQNSFNIPSLGGSLTSRNSTLNGIPSGGMQQSSGNLPTGRLGSNNLPVGLSQISHGSSHGHPGVTNRGGMNLVGGPGYNSGLNGFSGSIPGVPSASSQMGNHSAVPGLGVSHMLGNTGSRITTSMGNMDGTGNIRSLNSGGGLSMPGLASRLNLPSNSASNSLGLQGQNRLMNGSLQQASPQVLSLLRNSHASGGGLSQNHGQAANNLSSMAMRNDMNPNDNAPFGIDDFPVLTSRPNSAGGHQGQIGSMRRQGVAVGSLGHQNQEFSIQNEDFPALPGYKSGSADHMMDLHQKDQLLDTSISGQNQHYANAQMGGSSGFTARNTYLPQHSQQQLQHQQHVPSSRSNATFANVNSQDFLQFPGADKFSSSDPMYHLQGGGAPDSGHGSLKTSNTLSGAAAYDQQVPQYRPQSPSQFHLRQLPAVNQRDQGVKSSQATLSTDPFTLLGLVNVTRMTDPDVTCLALGCDPLTLGLDLNSEEKLYKTFGSPFSDGPVKSEPNFSVPQCYNEKSTPMLTQIHFLWFNEQTLFYIFYSMPQDKAQIQAAAELYKRGWVYHKKLQVWLMRTSNTDSRTRTSTFETGSYFIFDPRTWEKTRKENFVLQYDLVENRPTSQ